MTSKNKILSYIVGLALGDGNLSNPNGRAVRLRITCDTKYPELIQKICSSIQKILPNNKVSIIKRATTFCDVSCYSNSWEKLLGWKALGGSKYKQNVTIPKWIKENRKYSIECLRGLLETDGSIYLDRGYKMINFVTIIKILAQDTIDIINRLGYKAKMYELSSKTKIRYNIRLSKDVESFIQEIGFIKK